MKMEAFSEIVFYPENIPTAISKYRADHEVPTFCSNTFAKPFSGGQCQVFKLGFSDGTSWAVRIPVYLSCPKDMIVTVLRNELHILERLEESGFPYSPRVVGYDLTFINSVGFPYIVLTWISGSPLQWTDNTPSRRADRDKVASHIAKIVVSLVSCTRIKSKPTPILMLQINE